MTVDVLTHTGTLFELRSRQKDFNGSLLEIHSMGDNDRASMVSSTTNLAVIITNTVVIL